MSWWNPFTKAQPAIDRRPSDDPATKVRVSTISVGSKAIDFKSSWDAQAAMMHPTLYRVMHKIASSVASVDWYARKIDDKPRPPGKRKYEKKETVEIDKVLAMPTNDIDGWTWKYWAALNMAAYGGFFYKVGADSTGKLPNGLYPLVTPKMDWNFVNGILQGYKQAGTSNAADILLPTRRQAISSGNPKAWASHVMIPTLRGFPDEHHKMQGPLASIGLPAGLIDILLRRAIDTASGHMNSRILAYTESAVSPEQENSIVASLRREPGSENSGLVTFISGAKVGLEQIDQDLSDLHSKLPMDDMSRVIAGAFGVPIALVGLGSADAAKFAQNYQESRQSFWEDTIIPNYCIPMQQSLSEAVAPEGYEIVFDYDTIQAILDARVKRAMNLEKVYFLDDDEKRVMCGFEATGKVYKRPGEKTDDPAAKPKKDDE